MSNYTKATNFATKDALTTGNPLKTVSGTEIDDEYSAIAVAVATKANTSNAALTGVPTAPTATVGNNTTQLATTAFVTTEANLKADLASPALTGTPTAPTAAANTNTTQLATTAFVTTEANLKADLAGGAAFTGPITMNRGVEALDSITMANVASGTYALVFRSDAVGNDNHSGFLLWGQNGYPDMRLRKDSSTVTALISSWEESYVSNGFRVTGDLIVSGTATATSHITSSDYRLKTALIPVLDAASRVNALKPVSYEWISSGERVDGFLAHELAEVIPSAASGTKDEVDSEGEAVMQGIDHGKIVPLLTAALQEALATIASLDARLTAVEGV